MKKFLLAIGVMALTLPAFAGVSTKDAISPEYLRNYGLSESGIEMVQRQMAASNGQEYVSNKRKMNKFMRYLRSYSPSTDIEEFNQHDIKFYATTQDL